MNLAGAEADAGQSHPIEREFRLTYDPNSIEPQTGGIPWVTPGYPRVYLNWPEEPLCHASVEPLRVFKIHLISL